MESHHDGDETKGSVYYFVQDYIEARESSRSVRRAGPQDLTVMVHWINGQNLKVKVPPPNPLTPEARTVGGA